MNMIDPDSKRISLLSSLGRFWFASTVLSVVIGQTVWAATEAPTGYDDTNGFVSGPAYGVFLARFRQPHPEEGGLGPLYNGKSCDQCHSNPATGGSSPTTTLRAGQFDGQRFRAPPGGSLISERAIDPAIQPRLADEWNVRSLRLAPSTLGDGFIEAIADETLLAIAARQPAESGGKIQGEAILVELVEAPGARRVGRFGSKDQHGSLLSFVSEAYRDELGLTNELFPEEKTLNGRSVAKYDKVADPEDKGSNSNTNAALSLIRATLAPPRDRKLAATASARAGERLFTELGCAICHVDTLTTAAAGTVINGGQFTIHPALGDKIIHPYSDFLLHDVGTGDGIVQNGGQSTRNKLRTAPLWGVRARSRFLHDGRALTIREAIEQHGGEAEAVIDEFAKLSEDRKSQLLRFLLSL